MKQFNLIVFDSTAVLQLLYSCAYSRAAAVDACIIEEPAIFNRSLYTPKRVGSLSEGNPEAFRQGVAKIFERYQAGFNTTLGEGTAVHYLEQCVNVRNEARTRIQGMHAYVRDHNARQDGGLAFAFHVTNTVRAVCTVALATGAVIAGAPGALIFTGYKVASAYVSAPAADSNHMGHYRTAYGCAIGKIDNGVISVGDAAQEVLNYGIKRGMDHLASSFLKRVSDEFRSNQKLILDLEKQIAHHAGRLMADLEREGMSKTAQAMQARLAQGIAQKQAQLAAARQGAARTVTRRVAGSTALRAAAKGIPIVFLANDVISAYNEWYDTERQFNPGL